MVIQKDFETDLSGVGHDLVHDLNPVQALQVGILVEIDAVGRTAGIEQLIAVGQADRIEAQRLHLIHHLLVAASPETMRCKRSRFKSKPIDSGDSHRVVIGVENLAARGVQVAAGNADLQIALNDRHITQRETRRHTHRRRSIVILNRTGCRSSEYRRIGWQ